MKPTRWFALGGMQEIGKACHVTEHEDEIVIIDSGNRFVNSMETGVDAMIPNWKYLVPKSKNVLGVFLTHGHLDHIGAVPHLVNQVGVEKIYAPGVAIAFIKRIMKEARVKRKVEYIEITKDLVVQGKNVKIDFWTGQHSIPDAFGIRVTTPNGSILDTGDFRFDYSPIGNLTDFSKLEEMGKEGVTLLTSDSTNAMTPDHSPTEQMIINDIDRHIRETKGKVIITTFASNMHRVKLAIDLAFKNKRKVCLFGRSMLDGTEVGTKQKFIDVPESVFVDKKDLSKLQDNEILILCTGSQGEEFAALNRMATDAHQYVKLKSKDVVIFSASPIPGNRIKIEYLINRIYKLGATVKEHGIDGMLHISGHAYKNEHLKIFDITKPKYFIPCHGFYRQSAMHAATAIESGIPKDNVSIIENGRVVEILNNELTVSDEVIECDPIFIDSGVATDHTVKAIMQREELAQNGFINVVAKINRTKKIIVGKTKIITRGTLYAKDSQDEMAEIQKLAHGTILYHIKNLDDWDEKHIEKVLTQRLQNMFYKLKRRRPMIVFSMLDGEQKD